MNQRKKVIISVVVLLLILALALFVYFFFLSPKNTNDTLETGVKKNLLEDYEDFNIVTDDPAASDSENAEVAKAYVNKISYTIESVDPNTAMATVKLSLPQFSEKFSEILVNSNVNNENQEQERDNALKNLEAYLNSDQVTFKESEVKIPVANNQLIVDEDLQNVISSNLDEQYRETLNHVLERSLNE